MKVSRSEDRPIISGRQLPEHTGHWLDCTVGAPVLRLAKDENHVAI